MASGCRPAPGPPLRAGAQPRPPRRHDRTQSGPEGIAVRLAERIRCRACSGPRTCLYPPARRVVEGVPLLTGAPSLANLPIGYLSMWRTKGWDMTATTTEDRLDATFSALANTTRRAMLARLAHGEATVNELAEPFALSLPAISKHLKVLERAGLVVRGQNAQYRPRTLDPAPLEEVSSWAEQYRPVWEARLDRMDTYLQQLRRDEKDA